jgi:hypothetical protein
MPDDGRFYVEMTPELKRVLLEFRREELRTLERGDIVRHADGDSCIVLDNNNGRPIAIRTIEISNPQEWTIVKRHDWNPRG